MGQLSLGTQIALLLKDRSLLGHVVWISTAPEHLAALPAFCFALSVSLLAQLDWATVSEEEPSWATY